MSAKKRERERDREGSGETPTPTAHVYVPFQPLPSLPIELLTQSPFWLRQQSVMRQIVRIIQNPAYDDGKTVAELIMYLEGGGGDGGGVEGGGGDGGRVDINTRLMSGPTIRVWAEPTGKVIVVKPTQLPRELFRPLLAAVRMRKLLTAHHLLAMGADVQQASEFDGATALMFAAARGDDPLVEMLLDYDANLLKVDAEGRTALVYALGTHTPSVPAMLRMLRACPALVTHVPHAFYGETKAFWSDMLANLLEVGVFSARDYRVVSEAIGAAVRASSEAAADGVVDVKRRRSTAANMSA